MRVPGPPSNQAAHDRWRARRRGRLAGPTPYPSYSPRVQILGFPPLVFRSSSGDRGVVSILPQRPCRIRRIFGQVARTGPTSTGLVLLNSIRVGLVDVRLEIPLETLSEAAHDLDLLAHPGQHVECAISIMPPPVDGDSVAVAIALRCDVA